MANLSVETWLRFLAWLVIGLLVYAGYGYRHSRLPPRGAGAGCRRAEPVHRPRVDASAPGRRGSGSYRGSGTGCNTSRSRSRHAGVPTVSASARPASCRPGSRLPARRACSTTTTTTWSGSRRPSCSTAWQRANPSSSRDAAHRRRAARRGRTATHCCTCSTGATSTAPAPRPRSPPSGGWPRSTPSTGARLRVVGEVDFGATERDWLEWQRYESVINEALAGWPLWGLCLFDTAAPPPAAAGVRRRAHPPAGGHGPAARGATPPSSTPPTTCGRCPCPDEPLEATAPAPLGPRRRGLHRPAARRRRRAGRPWPRRGT